MQQEASVVVSCQPTTEEEAIRTEMAAIHDALKPLKAEVQKLESRFIKLWNEKLRLERQRVPVVKVKGTLGQPTESRPTVLTAETFLEKLEKLPAAQQAEVLKSLLKNRKEAA